MEFDEFTKSIGATVPPALLNVYAQALWHDAKGHWDKAHTLIQDLPDANAAWIHAYLHRKEGDEGNASYWYHRAGKKMPALPLDKEWEQIAKALLSL